MLKAIIFDFNGVILDDEPLHFAAMRHAVSGLGIDLTREAYWDRYLPFDDRECLEAICRDHGYVLDDATRSGTLLCKTTRYEQLLQGGFPLCAGAAHFVRAAAERYPLALASGARRAEIEPALEATGLRRHFTVIVAAEDFVLGKPSPESFLLALDRLNAAGNARPILPAECLVIEDSAAGVRGARAAGMACLAVTNSYPPEALQPANRIIASFQEIRLDSLNALFEEAV